MAEENQEEQFVDLLKKDLGKSSEELYSELSQISVDIDDRPIKDPRYFIQKITDTRRAIDKARTIHASLLRAKTIAQSRLTTLETRYEILMNSKLGDDPSVQVGSSIEDRKARAANSMVDIKRQIREAKNEVESIKNLREVVNMVLKNFTGLNNDLKQQSKLVEVEFKYMSVAPPGTNEEVDLFEQEMKAITDRHMLAITSVTSDEDEEEEDNPGLEGILALQETDTSVDTDIDTTPAEIPDAVIIPEAETAPEIVEAPPSFDVPEVPEEFSLPEESAPTLELPEEAPSLELPEEAPTFSLPVEIEETPEEKIAEKPTEVVKASVEETESEEEDTESVDEDSPFTLPPDFDDSTVVEPDPDLPVLSLDGFSMPEGVPEVPVKVIKEAPKKAVEVPLAKAPMASDGFQVASVTVVDPKISKHFAGEIEAATPKAEAKPEPTGTVKPPEKKAPADIDDVLALLGV